MKTSKTEFEAYTSDEILDNNGISYSNFNLSILKDFNDCGGVRSCVFFPPTILVTGSNEGILKIFDLDLGKEIQVLKTEFSSLQLAKASSFSFLACGCSCQILGYLYSGDIGFTKSFLYEVQFRIGNILKLRDNLIVASTADSSKNHGLILMDLENGLVVKELKNEDVDVNTCLLRSKKSQNCLYVSNSSVAKNTVKLIDYMNGEVKYVFGDHVKQVYSIECFFNSRREEILLLGEEGQNLYFYNSATGCLDYKIICQQNISSFMLIKNRLFSFLFHGNESLNLLNFGEKEIKRNAIVGSIGENIKNIILRGMTENSVEMIIASEKSVKIVTLSFSKLLPKKISEKVQVAKRKMKMKFSSLQRKVEELTGKCEMLEKSLDTVKDECVNLKEENKELKEKLRNAMKQKKIGVKTIIRFCAACGEKNPANKCSRCVKVFYCSRKCQSAHWKVHRDQCTKK